METLKFDYNINSSNMLMGNFSDYSDVEIGAVGAGTAGAVKWPQFHKKTTHNGLMALIRYTRIIGPTLVNEANASWSHRPEIGTLLGGRAEEEPAQHDRLQRAAVQPRRQSAGSGAERDVRRRHQSRPNR